ncbi:MULTISPECIES: hypothetical protein [Nocardiaceae]|uniref:hypothetical protein n=1 Tax=Nocardiaceae TaxID=85025 RepID=UPI0027820213|nr:hypothetical protein [Rhodococcus fascians]MDQ0281744.1 hypothetical protein [Rhodococcus fascians]
MTNRNELPPYVDDVLEILQTHMSFYVDSSGMACELSDRMPDYPAEEEPSWVALVSNAFIALDWLAKTFPNDVRVIDDWSPYVERDAALFRWVGEPSE